MMHWLSVLVALTVLGTCCAVGAVAEEASLAGEITITSWNSSYTAIVEGAKQFMAMHPEAVINVEQVSDNTKLYTQLATNTGVPDIMQFQNRDMKTALAKYPGSFLDVTDVMEPKAADIVPAVLPLCKDGDTYYAIPWDIAPAMLFYRTDIFEANGIDASAIATWDVAGSRQDHQREHRRQNQDLWL
jgi:lactose/L-arabinose transport system substrate-binding protein